MLRDLHAPCVKIRSGSFRWIAAIVHVDFLTPDEYCIGKIHDTRKVKVRWRKQSAEEQLYVNKLKLYRHLHAVIAEVYFCRHLCLKDLLWRQLNSFCNRSGNKPVRYTLPESHKPSSQGRLVPSTPNPPGPVDVILFDHCRYVSLLKY